MYESDASWQVKDALAVFLANSAGPDQFDQLVDPIEDRSHGEARALLLTEIGKSSDARVQALLERLAADEAIRTTVLDVLK